MLAEALTFSFNKINWGNIGIAVAVVLLATLAYALLRKRKQ